MSSEEQRITFKSVKNGNTQKCMNKFVSMIKDDLKLMNDQIVSISVHDTQVRHGDLEAVVFYRTRSILDNSEPMESLSYNTIIRDEDVEWNTIQSEVLMNANESNKMTVAIGSTFRNVGDEKVSITFQMDGRQNQVYERRFQSQEPWEKVIEYAKMYLDTFITPKEFAGLVMFEEEHPLLEREAATGTRNITIYHTAGDNPIPIREQTEVISDIYTFTTIQSEEKKDWTELYQQVEQKIADSGETHGFFVATATTSDDDNNGFQTALIVKYDN